MVSIKKIVVCAALLASLSLTRSTPPALAHHGGGVEYDLSQQLGPITGVVTRFAFRFPHPYIELDVTDENGDVQHWIVVTSQSPTLLRERGWRRDSIQPGDTLTVSYHPHRTAANVGFARRILVNGEFLDENV